MTPVVIGLWLSLVERVAALWGKIKGGKGNPPTPPPNATTGDPAAPAPRRKRHVPAALALCLALALPSGTQAATRFYIGVCPEQCNDSMTLNTMGTTAAFYYRTAVSRIKAYRTFREMIDGPWQDCVPAQHYRVDVDDSGNFKLSPLKKKTVSEEVTTKTTVTREEVVDEIE